MADMPGDDAPHLATAGRRLRIKILLALVLASGVPILVLAYVVRGLIVPGLVGDPALDRVALRAVLVVTALGVVAGGYIIWDIGGTVARIRSAGKRRLGEIGRCIGCRRGVHIGQKLEEDQGVFKRLTLRPGGVKLQVHWRSGP